MTQLADTLTQPSSPGDSTTDSVTNRPITNANPTPNPTPAPRLTQVDELVLLVTQDQKRYLLRLREGRNFHCHLGLIEHAELIGKSLGTTVFTQLGHAVLILDPSLSDLMTHLKRGTQIIYPKDAAYLVHRMSLRAGSRVIEAGTGSGGLTTALAWAVAPTGTVYTYETRPEIYNLARNNLERVGLLDHVKMHQKSIEDGFEQSGVDALFLDVREPWHFLPAVQNALRPGGYFASLLPTTNQVSDLLFGLEAAGFSDIAVEEILLRAYKPVPDRLRPDDNMVGHTGFLIFARHIIDPVDPSRWLSRDRKRYAARTQAAATIRKEEERRAEERAAGGLKYPMMNLPD